MIILESSKATAKFAKQAGISPPSPSKFNTSNAAAEEENQNQIVSKISSIPEFSSFGPIFKSSLAEELTESDVAEYVVSCVKHIFSEYIVFEVILYSYCSFNF